MTGEVWEDGIVDEKTWQSQKGRRLLIVGPEPNGMGYENRQRDMRELLKYERKGRFLHRVEQIAGSSTSSTIA